MKHVLFFLLCLGLLTACQHDVPFAYKMDIQQGNILKPEKIKQVKVGMSQSEVDALLGAPISRDTFKQTRWNYVYYLKKNHEPVVERQVVIYFDDAGRVSRVEDLAPAPEADVPPADPT
jgi:outer membrane protein assembly factor BamE